MDRSLLPDYDVCVQIGTSGGMSSIPTYACMRGWGSLHPGEGFNMVAADGSVHFISQNIDMYVWAYLCSLAGYEEAQMPGG